jgi:hypothetical protein
MKTFITTLGISILVSSCSIFNSLESNTSIKPKDSFVLGNNEHGKFKVQLKNVSNHPVEIHFAPIAGGTYSYQTISINEVVETKVPKNTAIVIENKSSEYASIDIKATGDLNLGMGFQK